MDTTQYWRIILEATPMIVALFVIINGTIKAISVRNKIWRSLSWMFVMSAGLLIIAQSSWAWSYFVNHDLLGTDISNIIWSVFNTLAMTSMLFALKESKK